MKSAAQQAREGLLQQLGPDHERYKQFCVIHDRAMMITDALMQIMGKPSRRIAIGNNQIMQIDDLLVLQLNEIISGLNQGFMKVVTAGEARIIELEEKVKLLEAKEKETKH